MRVYELCSDCAGLVNERIGISMKKFKVLGVVAIVVLLTGAVAAFLLFYKPKEMRQDYQRLQNDIYNGIFVSDYETDYYEEDVFLTYRGIPVVKAEYKLEKAEDYADYMNEAWASGNQITNVYLGVDPYALWQEAGEKQERWEELIEFNILRYVEAHPDVTFEVMLPYDSLVQWLDLEEADYRGKYDSYAAFVDKLDDYTNVVQYYVGGQEWLIANPGNYMDGQANEEIAKKLILLCFCDHEYVITSGNAKILLEQLEAQVSNESDNPVVYEDLSEYAFVFFGDSIIANAKGSHSIPGVLSGLTGAQSYNLAVGGIPATVDPKAAFSLPYMVETFIAGGDTGLDAGSDYAEGLNLYLAANVNKKHVFVLNFGLNDYFGGHPVSSEEPQDLSTYTGALRQGISKLQKAYPEAAIIVQTPTYTNFFSEGQDILCEDGSGRVLADYADAAIAVGEELGVYCLDNFYGFEMNGSNYETYLSDGCHPNDYGCYVLGKRLAMFAQEILD